LGDDLDVTAAEPATEMTSVAAVAPAKVLATAPTYLQHRLLRLADDSRAPTPEGSLPACAWSAVATRTWPPTFWVYACQHLGLVLGPKQACFPRKMPKSPGERGFSRLLAFT